MMELSYTLNTPIHLPNLILSRTTTLLPHPHLTVILTLTISDAVIRQNLAG